MVIEAGSRLWILVPVYGPSLEGVSAEIALAPAEEEPEEADWHLASWMGDEAALLGGAPGAGGGAVEYPFGEYMLRLRLTAGSERVVLPSGRVRVGS
jgi:hypothetical protein